MLQFSEGLLLVFWRRRKFCRPLLFFPLSLFRIALYCSLFLRTIFFFILLVALFTMHYLFAFLLYNSFQVDVSLFSCALVLSSTSFLFSFIRFISHIISCFPILSHFLPFLSIFQNSYFTLFTFEFVLLRPCHRWWMFVRFLLSWLLSLDPYPVLFLPFLPSVSDACLNLTGRWDAFRRRHRRAKILQRGSLPR